MRGANGSRWPPRGRLRVRLPRSCYKIHLLSGTFPDHPGENKSCTLQGSRGAGLVLSVNRPLPVHT